MSGSGISWAVCKSAPRSRQTTTPAPHHSVFLQTGCPSCRPTNGVKALKTHSTVLLTYLVIASAAQAMYTCCSVCPSVCLSVCWAHGGTVQKRLDGSRCRSPAEGSRVPEEPCTGRRAHWRHLANTTERLVRGGDAALCPVTLTRCCMHRVR